MLIRFGSLEYVFLFAVSPCVNNPCENNGTCGVDVNGNATCTCDGNWNGTYCQGNAFSERANWHINITME